jgi:hypothetical protein
MGSKLLFVGQDSNGYRIFKIIILAKNNMIDFRDKHQLKIQKVFTHPNKSGFLESSQKISALAIIDSARIALAFEHNPNNFVSIYFHFMNIDDFKYNEDSYIFQIAFYQYWSNELWLREIFLVSMMKDKCACVNVWNTVVPFIVGFNDLHSDEFPLTSTIQLPLAPVYENGKHKYFQSESHNYDAPSLKLKYSESINKVVNLPSKM